MTARVIRLPVRLAAAMEDFVGSLAADRPDPAATATVVDLLDVLHATDPTPPGGGAPDPVDAA